MRKRFGQHFLTDRTILQQIITAFSPANGQKIIEIGAGQGALTDAIIAKLDNTPITAIELDKDLAAYLKKRYADKFVEVIQMDILDANLHELTNRIDTNIAIDNNTKPATHTHHLRLIGNLPYNISTPLIFHLLKQLSTIQDMLFMVQKEVALRLVAEPGNKQYGRLSVMTNIAVDCKMLFDVPPQAFHPPPKVNSTVIHITPKKTPLQPINYTIFNDVIIAAFSQRRKILCNSLAKLAQEQHFQHANVNPQLRAEVLSVQQYVALSDAIAQHPTAP